MTRRLALVAVVATICFPGNALASSAGVVLSVDGHHHALQVVGARHVVHAYRFRGRLRGVALGTRVRISLSGQMIKRLVRRPGHAHSVSFYGRVVRVRPHRIVLRLGDRKLMRLPAKLIRSTSWRHWGLAPGEVLLVTETLGSHGVRSFRLRRVGRRTRGGASRGGGNLAGGGSGGGASTVDGTVVELDPDALSVLTADGSTFRLSISGSLLTSLQLSLCDTITVGYHTSEATLVADSVQSSDSSDVGACANVGDAGGSGATGQDAVGTIVRLTQTSVTIAGGNGSATAFSASLELSVGFMIGDQVDVTYTPSGGTLLASNLVYYDQDAIGKVVHVDSGTLQMVLAGTNQVVTFTADPIDNMFDGVSVGDKVDISYHLSSGQSVLDSVTDLTTPI